MKRLGLDKLTNSKSNHKNLSKHSTSTPNTDSENSHRLNLYPNTSTNHRVKFDFALTEENFQQQFFNSVNPTNSQSNGHAQQQDSRELASSNYVNSHSNHHHQNTNSNLIKSSSSIENSESNTSSKISNRETINNLQDYHEIKTDFKRLLLPVDHFSGLYNNGNMCYCSSVLQALYACPPFRNRILSYKSIINNDHISNEKDYVNNGNSSGANGTNNLDSHSNSNYTHHQLRKDHQNDREYSHLNSNLNQNNNNTLNDNLLESFNQNYYNNSSHKVTPEICGNFLANKYFNNLVEIQKDQLDLAGEKSSTQMMDGTGDAKPVSAKNAKKRTASGDLKHTSAATKLETESFWMNNVELSTQDVINLLLKEKINPINIPSDPDNPATSQPPKFQKIIRNQKHKQDLLKLNNDTMITQLNDLFSSMYFSKDAKKKTGKTGKMENKRFVNRMYQEFQHFYNDHQHDAHEFLVGLLSNCGETLENEEIVKTVLVEFRGGFGVDLAGLRSRVHKIDLKTHPFPIFQQIQTTISQKPNRNSRK